MPLTDSAENLFRDFEDPLNPGAGAHKPSKSAIRVYLGEVENILDALDLGASSRIISTSAPSGIPLDGQEWIVVDA